MTRDVSLSDKYELDRGRIYLTGIQTLVRIAIDQRRIDVGAGLKTAGFVSGYRGSPLGGVDQEFTRNKRRLDPLDVRFVPGVNEELGATAVWGTQKLGLHGKGSDYDGVFGIWYGKSPGVDRAGDVLKQASASGTAKHGGVLALCGDDLLAKSSVLPAQSEYALQHFEMPFFNPADLQEVLDYGLHGIALSRYAGNWTGMICVADTMDASGLVNVPSERCFVFPEATDPRRNNDLNRPLLLGNRLETERLLRDIRLPAVTAYTRANGLDGIAFGNERARIGFVATGKAYRDLRQALDLLGIDEARARRLGVAIYKVAMPWPLDALSLTRFARGKELLVVVEHKRGFLETQVKEALYGLSDAVRPQVWGKRRADGEALLSDVLELRPQDLVQALLSVIPGASDDEAMRAVAMRMIERSAWAAGHAEGGQRTAYFCSGCPHSTSTKVPEGSRALPGIGCHAMTEINGATTDGQIAMGGEGVPWVGQAMFSRDKHAFANMGDGTYYHSGLLAIRQAISANVAITYKILFNDAVAMTGGQPVDGPLTVPALTRQLAAEGVGKIAVLSERPELYADRDGVGIAPGVPVLHRDELLPIEAEFAAYPGVSAIVYDQTCAAEKRRRRKKGEYDDPARRLFINPRVCEGCGDCSVQSNCISVEPLATGFGEKRIINQSSCNKDFSCVKGFCPSFAWVEGATIRKAKPAELDIAALVAGLAAPSVPLAATHNVLVTGIGGFGVTTVAAVLAMAGHIDGLTVSTLDMTGLAQKNGPVTSHLRFGPEGSVIEGPRVPAASLDTLLATDMLVACNADSLAMMAPEKTLAVANTHVAPTAEFVMKRVLSFDEARMVRTLKDGARDFVGIDAAHVAEKLFGDQIYMNMLLVGVAFQSGGLPLTAAAVERAITMNGASPTENIAAFRAGRVLAANPAVIAAAVGNRDVPAKMSLPERTNFLAAELTAYQDSAYAGRFVTAIAALTEADEARGQKGLRLTALAVESLFKAMAYKDEYEVARLYSDPAYATALAAEFEDPKAVRLMLAPPLLSRTDPATGRPKKRAFGPWIFPLLRVLAHGRRLRGTRADPFGRTAERQSERAMVEMAFADILRATRKVGTAPYGLLCELVRIPSTVRGFGPVKDAARDAALAKRAVLLTQLAAQPVEEPMAVAAE